MFPIFIGSTLCFQSFRFISVDRHKILFTIFEGLYGMLFLFLLYVCVSTCCCKKSKEPEVLEVNNQNFDLMN